MLAGNLHIPSSGLTELCGIEAESCTVCEECGKLGKPRKGGWIKTLCDECAAKRIIVKAFS